MSDLILTVTGNFFRSYSSTPFTFTGDSLSVDWGDGNTETYTHGKLTHTYSSSGNYTITITGNITSIRTNCFYECFGLTSVTIPNSVTSIGTYSFGYCSLENIIFEPSTPPSISSNVFYGVPTSCVIHVPQGSLSAYTSASNYPSSSTYTYVEYDDAINIFEDAVSVVINEKEVESIILSNNRVLYQKPNIEE